MTDSKDTTMSEEAVPTTEITTDGYHCDPNADVTIISKDNVRFKASSHFLVKFRFFEDLLLFPHSDNTKPPIYLDYPSNAIRAFLVLASTPPEYKYSILERIATNAELWEPLFGLLEFTLCDDSFVDELRGHLIHNAGPSTSRDLLKLASNRQDPQLARAALENTHDLVIPTMCGHLQCATDCEEMASTTCEEMMNDYQDWFKDLSLPYQVEILQLMFVRLKHRKENYHLSSNTGMFFDEDDWEWIASKFDPDTPMSRKLVNH